MTAQERRLRQRDARSRDRPTQQAMLHLLRSKLVEELQNGPSAVAREIASTTCRHCEVGFADLSTANRSHDKAIRNRRAQFLEHVEGQRRPTRSEPVEVANLWIEPDGLKGTDHLGQSETVRKTHQRVDWITRWSTAPTRKIEARTHLAKVKRKGAK